MEERRFVMAAIDTVYNYYLTTYGKTNTSSRYESHKKSELRDIYNRIVKTNKEEPLYKINMNDDAEKFVIDLKEEARSAKNITSALLGDGKGIEGVFNQKIATSSQEDKVSVEYVSDNNTAEAAPFELGVKRLATPQVTMGNFLKSSGRSFEVGNFSFDMDTPQNSYEFQFETDGSETNLDIQKKIARLMNRSEIGIKADVVSRGDGTSALKITSKQTGLAGGEDFLFKIQSGSSWNEVHALGIDRITEPAGSAIFTLNGKEHKALSNDFTINNAFEISLSGVTKEDNPVKIGFKANVDSVGDSVERLTNAYNSFLKLGKKYSETNGYNRLSNEITGIWHTMGEKLTGNGIEEEADGTLTVNRDKLGERITGENKEETFQSLNSFRNAVSMEAEKVSVNPMKYVDKLVVEYKNPGRTFAAPYASSLYAGLMINEGL
jgi:flagellar hook-associated protein 2